MMTNRDPESPRELEIIVNETLGLSDTNGSGAVHGDADGKGRAYGRETYSLLLSECKFVTTPQKQFTIKKNDWEKTKQAARRFGRIPILSIADYGGEILVITSLNHFKRIYSVYKEAEEAGNNGKQ